MWENKVFIIAELSANHNNDFELAEKTIHAMAEAGADAVKIQTFKPQSLSIDVDNPYFGPKKDGLWKGMRPYDLYVQASMPYEWQPKLKEIAENLGLVFFSSPFDFEAVDFLEKMNVPAYKVASLEISDIPLIRYIAEKGKPVIISSGASSLSDLELALNTCRKVGNEQVAFLKCTSEYPAPFEAANLRTIPNMIETFGITVGVSDHTMGSTVPVVSVALGAKIIEKHFILDRSLGGPDSTFSMEPSEFKDMVTAVREAEKAIGKVSYSLKEKDEERRRSLFVSQDVEQGETITVENIRSVRPGYGLHPRHYETLLGKRFKQAVAKGTPLSFNLIDWE
ncbi:pseudaminic acid synthase [Catalinimonas niigatensis]|uniref:pseudaminic acid synthase n=1 Tax=Catalinimonas niigatensis TaxID=1397264 RepID=UPI0026657207|nr:pseudaminic acid synthase [Catalinimonas niigatensis]WPP53314.1 pseudaminic acid synthase [Catalinimonas niigatensis]